MMDSAARGKTAKLLLSALLCWAVSASPARVIDGDTFTADVRIFLGLTARETVRILGVNSPELKGATRPAGEAAKAFAETWLAGADLRLFVCQRDSFGRLLATVTRTSDGANLGDALIAAGQAVPYKP